MQRLAVRIATLEGQVVPPDAALAAAARERLRALPTAELMGLAVGQLIAHGAEPETADEAYENRWRLVDYGQARSWADLAPLLPQALAAYVADLKRRAEVCDAPAEAVARLEDGPFRRRVVAKASELWPPEGRYTQGFVWALERMAAGVPAEELTHAAYYGPVRGPEMAEVAAQWRVRHDAGGRGSEAS